MRRRDFIAGLIAACISGRPALAQARASRTVGVLSPGRPPADPEQRARPFRDGMAALGWREQRDVVYEHRYGEFADLDALARELVAARVDLLVTFGSDATRAARRATDRLPIVIAAAGDPLAEGLVASLARPGGNVTGVSLMVNDVALKQLEILKEALPDLKRVAMLGTSSGYEERLFARLKARAPGLSLEIARFKADGEEELPRVFKQMLGFGAVMVVPGPMMDRMRGRIGELALQHQIPSIGQWRDYAGAGFLFAYSARLSEMQRRAAVFVDKILKGARPGDLPIEQPSTFEFVINLNTAWALDVTIPPLLVARADEVIE